jgi:hypothetical protein
MAKRRVKEWKEGRRAKALGKTGKAEGKKEERGVKRSNRSRICGWVILAEEREQALRPATRS